MFSRRKEAEIAAKIDRLLAGEHIELPAGLLEEKIWQVLSTLELAEKKSKSEHENVLHFMSDISHQLKTPLASLKLHLDLASDKELSLEEREAFLTESKKQAEKIEWLSDTLFKMVRLENGLITVKKTSADLVETIRDALCSIQASADRKGLEIITCFPTVLFVEHDPLWTKEALCNLLDNAIKYTAKGSITVTLEQGPMYVRIDIADTGIGIAAEEYTKIFGRFYRIRSADMKRIEGTGLGLTIAREILRQQSGNITVNSEIGRGTVFSVFLQNC